jgi:hypothetical protein
MALGLGAIGDAEIVKMLDDHGKWPRINGGEKPAYSPILLGCLSASPPLN